MCGIAGEVDFNRYLGNEHSYHRKMLTALKHRGPDDSGTYNGDNAWIGHTRLSIIDLSPNGRQPMSNEDNTVWISFNGEIYNYQDWIPWLSERGHRFRSRTDTEIIIHLYEEMGAKCFQHLNGMFAIAIWDSSKNRLILARDRIGVKPLVYHFESGRIVFASEIKSMLQHPSIHRELDQEALNLYFTFNFIPSPWTIYRHIRKLPQAHYLTFDRNGIKITSYWDVPRKFDEQMTEEEGCGRIRDLILDATRIRLYSDVPICAFLSGGIDSSVVVAAASRSTSNKVKTFTIGYTDNKFYDESEYAMAVSRMYGTDHTLINVTERDSLELIPEILSYIDEPFADSSAIPSFLLSKMTKQHFSVALSGDGGDELFGGYSRYLAPYYFQIYRHFPYFFRQGIRKTLAALPDSKGNKLLEYIRQMKIFVDGAEGDEASRHYRWQIFFPDADRRELLEMCTEWPVGQVGLGLIRNFYDSYEGDTINKMLYADFRNSLPYDMLTKVDWMSMRHGLEVRSPLLDYRMAELAFSFNGSMKIKGANLKYILKNSIKDWIPKEIYRRGKKGFEVPIGEWLKKNEDFKKLFWGTIYQDKNGILLKKDKISSLFRDHEQNRRDHTHKLWAIMVFLWWYYGDFGPRH